MGKAASVLREKIVETVRGAVGDSPHRHLWRDPLVGFADARDAMFGRIREITHEGHVAPSDILEGAESVAVYFIPFSGPVIKSNIGGACASEAWITAYRETNLLIDRINEAVCALVRSHGYDARGIRATHNFESATLLSPWSHRHAAVAAGLGTLGVNRMLITSRGCCGRLGSVVTTAPLKPDSRVDTERCLYLRDASCGICLKRCPVGALHADRLDAKRCYGHLLENDTLHKGGGASDACGKCLCGLPCSERAPGQAG